MDFELKNTNPAQVELDSVTDVATIVQGFTTGVVGCPESYRMITGDTITIQVVDYSNKSVIQTNTEVITCLLYTSPSPRD